MGYQIRRAFIVAAFLKFFFNILRLGPEHEQSPPPFPPYGPLINFQYFFDFPLFFKIQYGYGYSEDSGIPGIPAFQHSGIPCFPNYPQIR